MSEIDIALEQIKIFYEKTISFIFLYLNEFIIGIVILSIVIVIISMIYVLVLPRNSLHSKLTKSAKPKKVKYTKEFLKGVKDIDLNLKNRTK